MSNIAESKGKSSSSSSSIGSHSRGTVLHNLQMKGKAIGQTLSQLDGNSMGGESGNPRNPTGAAETSGFAVATVPPRQRRMGTVVPPQGLILPENSPPTKSLLMEFPASEQDTSEHQPLTKSPSRFASPEDVKSRLSGAKKAVENLEVELPKKQQNEIAILSRKTKKKSGSNLVLKDLIKTFGKAEMNSLAAQE
ncbi:hypothetical protein RUM44_004836 [Polyplax serrata]|uniref:WH2 domain-containing protein n=1 Tax=Polyplax serrata TaxID=468196 RepID=A0ABR1B4G4_POLSC